MNTVEKDKINRLLESVEREEATNANQQNANLQAELVSVRRRLFSDSENDVLVEEEPLSLEEPDDTEDHVEDSDHQTDTEESADENDDITLIPGPKYYGKDNTLWDIYPKPKAGRSRTRRRNIVIHPSGSRHDARNVTSPIEAWQLFFTDDVLDKIVIYTNIWIQKQEEKFVRLRDANNTTRSEIKAVIGLLYLAGVMKSSHTNVKDLWCKDGTGIERFRTTMNMKRFLFLLRAMRFDDVNTREERRKIDKLAPIREIFDGFVEKCKRLYSVSEFVTIDEMLEAFRGRCSFRQYISNKPAKYGLKMFAMADAKTFYTKNLEVYVGEQPEGPYRQSNKPLDVVDRLVQPISQSGRNVTTDNWYTSVPLADKLLADHRLTLVGTIRKNKREIPPIFLEGKIRPVSSSMFGFREDAVLVSYVPKKNKVVLLLSTMHESDEIDPTSGDKNKPAIMTFYNCTKGGVDVVDELKGNYSVSRITNRWSQALFYSLLNIAGINSYVILNSNEVEMNRRKFLKTLSNSLCQEFMEYRVNLRCIPRGIRLRLQEYLGKDTRQNQEAGLPGGAQFPGRCAYCDRTKNRKSKTKCVQCGNFICREHTTFSCLQCADPDHEMEIGSE